MEDRARITQREPWVHGGKLLGNGIRMLGLQPDQLAGGEIETVAGKWTGVRPHGLRLVLLRLYRRLSWGLFS